VIDGNTAVTRAQQVAAGGSDSGDDRVVANPLGREFGFARRISLTQAGRVHPMFRDKPAVFEAITVHRDCVVELPAASVELAYNDMGLQAVEMRVGGAVVWGVQYHPEYTLVEIAATARRYAAALGWKHGLGPGVLDPQLRVAELRNWLRSI